jgi:hypothetical protein
MNMAAEQWLGGGHNELTDDWSLWRDFAVRSAGSRPARSTSRPLDPS